MAAELRESFRVRSFEIDGHRRALLKTLTNYLQETAIRHAIELKVARGQMEDHLTWMLSRLRLEMKRWPHWGDEVEVRTWPSGLKGLFALRDFELKGWGVATSGWVVVDVHKRRPVRVPEAVKALRPENPERALVGFETLPDPEAVRYDASFPVRWTECDMNGHANQASYVGWAVDVLPGEFLAEHVPTSLEIEFRAEARPGDVVISESDGASCILRRETDHKELARLRIGWSAGILPA
ncbi:MAG: acyl-[acyl-carrier-protein] thioesterase [Planctomycetota bacterium]